MSNKIELDYKRLLGLKLSNIEAVSERQEKESRVGSHSKLSAKVGDKMAAKIGEKPVNISINISAKIGGKVGVKNT